MKNLDVVDVEVDEDRREDVERPRALEALAGLPDHHQGVAAKHELGVPAPGGPGRRQPLLEPVGLLQELDRTLEILVQQVRSDPVVTGRRVRHVYGSGTIFCTAVPR